MNRRYDVSDAIIYPKYEKKLQMIFAHAHYTYYFHEQRYRTPNNVYTTELLTEAI